tara:strand:- start:361 stop:777 length:417 start_codon:yes stop_codon:yes gene_type:complete
MSAGREILKPFCRMVIVATGTTTNVELTETSGTGMVGATYVSVEPASGSIDEQGWFHVAPSSNATSMYLSSTGNPEVSGAPGHIGGSLSQVSFSLNFGQRQESINITNNFDVDVGFAVNYGIIQNANPVRDGAMNAGR